MDLVYPEIIFETLAQLLALFYIINVTKIIHTHDKRGMSVTAQKENYIAINVNTSLIDSHTLGVRF